MTGVLRVLAGAIVTSTLLSCKTSPEPGEAAPAQTEPKEAPAEALAEVPEPAAEPSVEPPARPAWIPDRGLIVAHALGKIDGQYYTNSLEAFRKNYAAGFRWFEVDLALTADGDVVCFHTGLEREIGLEGNIADAPTAKVLRKKYGGRYRVVTFAKLLDEASTREDVVLVTDTKGWTPEMAKAVRDTVLAPERAQPRPRLVYQVYREEDFPSIGELAEVTDGSLFLTLYLRSLDDRQVVALAKEHGLGAIVASTKRFNPWLARDLRSIGVPIVVHTVDDPDHAAQLTKVGAAGVYANTWIMPEKLDTGPAASLETLEAEGALTPWRRTALHDEPTRFFLKPCVTRHGREFGFESCDDGTAVYGPYFFVPGPSQVHVTAEVRSGGEIGSFWIDAVAKWGTETLRGPQSFRVMPGATRRVEFDIHVPRHVPDLEVRLGRGEPKNSKFRIRWFEIEVRPDE